MWTRTELKQKAKNQMKGRYFSYLAVSIMPQISTFILLMPVYLIYFIIIFASLIPIMASLSDGNNSPDLLLGFSVLVFPIIFISIYFFIFAIMIFFTQPVIVGTNRWIVRSRENQNIPIFICFSAFRKGAYLKTVGSMAYMMLFSMLWTLLFYIPGIVKYYSYRMIPFILADNPGIGAKRALALSTRMTAGHKMDMFVLDMSFIGWFILGYMVCAVGLYAVIPYYQATLAELYDVLKKDAVRNGYCTMEELGYVKAQEKEIPSAV